MKSNALVQVSHTNGDAGLRRCNLNEGSALLGPKDHANHAGADAESGPVLQDGSACAFAFKKCAVRGIQVFQVDEAFARFDEAVVARDFSVVQRDVRTLAAEHRAAFGERKALAGLRAALHGQDHVNILRQR